MKVFFKILVLFVIFIAPALSSAQCAMCRAVLESEESGVKAEAINDGIVYLMAVPYIMVALIGYLIYRVKSKKTNAK